MDPHLCMRPPSTWPPGEIGAPESCPAGSSHVMSLQVLEHVFGFALGLGLAALPVISSARA
jgi:hypothetical protein